MFKSFKELRANGSKLIFIEIRWCLWASLFYPCNDVPATALEICMLLVVETYAFIVLCVTTLGYVFLRATDSIDILECQCTMIMTYQLFLKKFWCHYKRETIRLLILRVQAEWDENTAKLKDSESVGVLEKSKQICRQSLFVFIGLATVAVGAYTGPLIMKYLYYSVIRQQEDYEKVFPLKML